MKYADNPSVIHSFLIRIHIYVVFFQLCKFIINVTTFLAPRILNYVISILSSFLFGDF